MLYLQYEDKIIHRLVTLEEVVLWWSLVFLVKLEFLHNARVLDQSQKDLFWEMRWLKRLYFYRQEGNRENQWQWNTAWSFTIYWWFMILRQMSILSNDRGYILLALYKLKTTFNFIKLQILLNWNCLNWSLTGSHNCELRLPVARKRCVASRSCGETLTFISLSDSLNMEKSCCFLSWWDTLLFVRLSAAKTQQQCIM